MDRARGTFVGNICMLISERKASGGGGLEDVLVQVIDVTDVRNPTYRKPSWIDKLKALLNYNF